MSLAADHLRGFEGLRLDAYQDSGGVWTIGYGHTGRDVTPGLRITREEAEELLAQDLAWAQQVVASTVRVPLTGGQDAALTSLIYNIGAGAWQKSTALRRLNVGDYAGAADALTWWNKAGGKVVGGLVRRREAERAMFMAGMGQIEESPIGAPVGGGEAKPVLRSVTSWLSSIGLAGAIADSAGAFAQFKAAAPDVLLRFGVPLVFGAIFLAILLRRLGEARKGEH